MKTFIYKTQYSVPFYMRRRVTLGTCSECLVRNVNLLLKNDGEIQMALRSWRCGRAAWQVVKNMAYMWTLGKLPWKKKHASRWYKKKTAEVAKLLLILPVNFAGTSLYNPLCLWLTRHGAGWLSLSCSRIPRLVWNPKFHSCAHNRPPPVHPLSGIYFDM